jgi:hypothetical protein
MGTLEQFFLASVAIGTALAALRPTDVRELRAAALAIRADFPYSPPGAQLLVGLLVLDLGPGHCTVPFAGWQLTCIAVRLSFRQTGQVLDGTERAEGAPIRAWARAREAVTYVCSAVPLTKSSPRPRRALPTEDQLLTEAPR